MGSINDKVWRAIARRVSEASTASVIVGVLASKGGGTKTEDGDINMVGLAAIHEFGAPNANIPERSFIRRTFDMKKADMGILTGKLAKAIVLRKMSVGAALELLGQWGASEVKKTITEGSPIPPPLKPATVAAKGSSRPLVDTGRLVQAIAHEVIK